MTRNESPVHFMYPPDPTGRRANEAIQLQHAGLSQRAASDAHIAAIRARGATPNDSSEATQSTSSAQDLVPRTFAASQSSRPQARERGVVRTASDYTSSESSNGLSPRQHTPRTRTVLWYCCQGRGSDHGPYNVHLCHSCLTCGHQPCLYCREEIVIIRDRGAPIR